MKRVKMTLGHRQAALIWHAAAAGIDEYMANEESEPDQYRIGDQMMEALQVLTRAMREAGYDPMDLQP